MVVIDKEKNSMGNLIFYILIIFLPLGQLGRISRLGDVSFLFNDFLVGTVVIGYLIYKIIRKEKIVIDKIIKLIFLFIFVGFVSLVFNLSNYSFREIIISSLYLLRFIGYSFIYVIFSIYIKLIIMSILFVNNKSSLILPRIHLWRHNILRYRRI